VFSVWSFLFAGCLQELAGRGGGVEVGASSLCPMGYGSWFNVGIFVPLSSGGWGWCRITLSVMLGCLGPQGFLAPPSSVLRLNPSVLIPKEGDNLRSPFQATNPMRSSDASQAVVCVEESTRLGSVFLGFVVRLST
jgi:hypothetical protein